MLTHRTLKNWKLITDNYSQFSCVLKLLLSNICIIPSADSLEWRKCVFDQGDFEWQRYWNSWNFLIDPSFRAPLWERNRNYDSVCQTYLHQFLVTMYKGNKLAQGVISNFTKKISYFWHFDQFHFTTMSREKYLPGLGKSDNVGLNFTYNCFIEAAFRNLLN